MSSSNDFAHPASADPLLAPLKDSVDAAALARVVQMLADRDLALEDFLGSYEDLLIDQSSEGVRLTQGVVELDLDLDESYVWGRRLGTWAHVQGLLVVSGGTGGAGNPVIVSLPTTGWMGRFPAGTVGGPDIGDMDVQDAGTTNYAGPARLYLAGNTFIMVRDGQASAYGANAEGAITSPDVVRFNLKYRLAS